MDMTTKEEGLAGSTSRERYLMRDDMHSFARHS